ncbi:MAG: indole-3-glycerol phosphate synthase TrpC [Phycisphaerae bacterium]
MATVLDDIVRAKKEEVQRRKSQISVEELQSKALGVDRPRNFYAAVTKQPLRKVNLIAEIKKASPSAGVIRADFDPEKLARIYTEAGADALSVLTDEQFFQGDLEYIQRVKKVSQLPVLRKDFIIDEYQIYESRAYGADAILLITEILTSSQMIDMLILAGMLKMTSLIEVHSPESLMTVRQTVGFSHEGYSLLGINNRDLQTQKVDIGTTLRLIDMLEEDMRDELVSESGIKTAADIDKLAKAGVLAVLIGETFMRADNITAKIEELLGPMPTNE